MIQVNLDLAGAEWVIVAYLTGDENMLSVVRSGKSPHVVTGNLVTRIPEEFILRDHKIVGDNTDPTVIRQLRSKELPELLTMEKDGYFLPRTMSIRQAGKKSNHALNYGMKFRRFALENEITEADAKPLVDKYSTVAYPKLPEWWDRVRQKLRLDRTLTNCFGRRVTLLDEWGHELWMAAYSFEPQSTVVDTVNQALKKTYDHMALPLDKVRLGAQVHDSLMFQYPEYDLVGMAESILQVRSYMRPVMQINGQQVQLGCDVKIGRDWGHMREIKVADASVAEVVERLKEGIAKL